MGSVFQDVAGRDGEVREPGEAESFAVAGGVTHRGGRARRLLVVRVRRVDFVTLKACQKTCGSLSVAQIRRVMGAGHRMEPGLWREDVVGSARAVRSQLRDGGQLRAHHAEHELLGSGEGGILETWRTGWARSAALAGGATLGGRRARRFLVLWVHKADSMTPKVG